MIYRIIYPTGMKNQILFSFLLIFFLPTSLKAQWKGETGFTIGAILPNHSKNYSRDEEIGYSTKLGLNQSWYKPESKSSFRPEVGLNLERFAVDNIGFGGLGGGNSFEGAISSLNAEIAVLAQFRISKGIVFAVGPSGTFLITNYENLTNTWWFMQQSGGVIETNEFNRKYFLKPSFGIKTLLLKTDLSKKISLGLSFQYQWRSYKEYKEINNYEEIIQYSQTSEISLYLGIH
jgi:hypothetical protein